MDGKPDIIILDKPEKSGKKWGPKVAFAVIALLLLFVLANSIYFVNEGEYAIIKRFDKVVRIVQSAGLNIKAPLLDSRSRLTKKLEFYDLPPSEVITKDKKTMVVDTYAVWMIDDPLTFLQKAGNVAQLEQRLIATVYGSLKTTIGSLDQMDIIESRVNNKINEQILGNSTTSINEYGVELVDVQIKKFDLLDSNKNAVFERMISERNQIVATYLAEGEEKANMIRNSTDREKQILISKAQADAEQLKAEGESSYMTILSSAYNSSDRAAFYNFIRGLDAVKKSMVGDKTIILPSDALIVDILSGNAAQISPPAQAAPAPQEE
ncbi:MAG: protease modulator HflC [Clostridiales bacterium]|jgi:membrane protease subunit HflC|nr:protease modulator HflC [Clostridiales bacterium]